MLTEISDKAIIKDLEKGGGGSPSPGTMCASAGWKELSVGIKERKEPATGWRWGFEKVVLCFINTGELDNLKTCWK